MEKRMAMQIGLSVTALAVIFFVTYKKANETKEIPKIEEPVVEKKLSWSELSKHAPWSPRDSHASFVFDNKIWVLGGINGDGLVNKNRQIAYWKAPHFNDIWNSPDGLNWTKIDTENIWPVRRSMSIIEFNNKLLMFGGWSPATGYSNDLWESLDGINWKKTDVKLPWTAREGQIVEIFDGKLWVMGGVNYDKRKTFNDVWYTSDGISWVPASDEAPWSSRWDFALSVFNNKFFLMGGMDITGKEYNDVWTSEDGINWSLVSESAAWASRQGHSAVAIGDKLWLFGRLNDFEHPGPNDIWSTQDGVNWKFEEDLPWDGREDFTTAVLNDKIYVLGGMGQDWTWRNDVWSGELKTK